MSYFVLFFLSLGAGLTFCVNTFASAPVGSVNKIACAPTDPDVAAALIRREIWVTVDAGKNWVRLTRLPPIETGEDQPANKEELDFLDDSQNPIARFNDTNDQEAAPLRRTEWASPTPGTDAQDAIAGIFQSAAETYLAVDDDGAWAATLDKHLFLGGPNPGIRRRIRIPGSKGIAFDRDGLLWIASEDVLLMFRPEGSTFETRRWHAAGVKDPVLSSESGEILVPGREGLWVISSQGEHTSPSVTLQRMPKIEAVSAIPREKARYLVSLGRLKKHSPGEPVQDMYPVPSRIDQLVVNANGSVLLKSKGAGWFERIGGSWRPMPVRDVAVDALGRVWMGTDRGPIAPDDKSAPSRFIGAPGKDFSSLAYSAELELFKEPGPPPCRRLYWSPLPRARLFFSWGRGALTHVETRELEDRAGADTWLYLGIQLTWSLDPIKPLSCSSRNRYWQSLRKHRVAKTLALWSAWQRVHSSRPVSDDLFNAVISRIEKEQLEELIRITSGTYPAKE